MNYTTKYLVPIESAFATLRSEVDKAERETLQQLSALAFVAHERDAARNQAEALREEVETLREELRDQRDMTEGLAGLYDKTEAQVERLKKELAAARNTSPS